MKIFMDKDGREWIIKITISAVKYVRERCRRRNGEPLDLLSIIDVQRDGANADLLGEISSDPVLLVEVLYALVKGQTDAAGISEEQFYEGLTGDAIEEATRAIVSEVIDFFPEAKRRVLRAIWDRTLVIQQKFETEAKKQLESPEFVKKIDAVLRGNSFGSTPASSASTRKG